MTASLPRTILVPIDFSPGAERALDTACAFASKLDATVHLVHAIGAALPELSVALTDEMIATLRRGASNALEDLMASRRSETRFGSCRVVAGDARDAILAAASEVGADMIVMGTHGRRGVSRFLIGSVAEHVSRRASCPVLLIRNEVAP